MRRPRPTDRTGSATCAMHFRDGRLLKRPSNAPASVPRLAVPAASNDILLPL